MRSIGTILEIILALKASLNKTTTIRQQDEDHDEEFIWVAYLLMHILPKGKGLDRTLLCKLVQLILALR